MLRPGRPSVSDADVQAVAALMDSDRRQTIRQLAGQTRLAHTTVLHILKERLSMRKISSRWVQHQLTEMQKWLRYDAARTHLERYEREEDAFLSRIITLDETWARLYQPELKRQSNEWRHHGSPRRSKFPQTPAMLWQRFQDDGNVSRRYSTSRPRVKKPNEDRYLAVTAKRNRRSTASDLSHQLSSATGTIISRQTVYKRLGQIGLYARRLVRRVPLTATHCRLRLARSREHALWTPQQWVCVMFSDESRFSLQSDFRRTFIWRAPDIRYHQENITERHHYGGAGVLVWAGIILGSRTDLHVQLGTMISQIYRDVILKQNVRLLRGAMGAQFVFMDDNARPHRANIVSECLQSEDITRMDWPAFSPDLNPVEHVWDMLGRRVPARQPPPTCLPELRRALLFECCNIPQDQIDHLILSMPRRCTDCIASSGRHTMY
ncbi:Transposable element Tcb1 transposase, partial [Stegodyphus mimosarum]